MQKPKLLLLTSLSFLAYVLNAAKDERPNILFIFTDDHALNALGVRWTTGKTCAHPSS